jgi:hypothetical protein
MQTVDRGFAPVHPLGDLAGRHAHQMPQHHDVTLIVGKRPKCGLESPATLPARLVPLAGELRHLFAGDRPALAQMIDRDIPGHAENPQIPGRNQADRPGAVNAAGVRIDRARDDPGEGRLSGAVGPEQRVNLPRGDLEVHPAQCELCPKRRTTPRTDTAA